MSKVHKLKLPKATVKKPKPATPRQWVYTRRQAADLLGVSRDTIKNFEKNGQLEALKLNGLGSLALFKRTELLKLVGMTEKDVAGL